MAIAMPSKPNVTPAAARATAPDMTPLPSDIAKIMPSQPTTSPLPIVNQSAVLKFLTLAETLPIERSDSDGSTARRSEEASR